MSPYFLPDESIVSALNVASMRGVKVRIFTPEKNNIALVQWACITHLPELFTTRMRDLSH